MVKQIDKKIGENGDLKSFVVVLSKDSAKTGEVLTRLAQEAGVKNVPLTLNGEKDGPPDYEISPDADVTVLMWKGSVVKVNQGFKGDLSGKDIETVMSGVSKLLGD